MAYAVVKTGGKQYRVEAGTRIRVDKIGAEIGTEVELPEVLMLGGDKVAVGSPLVPQAKVKAKVVGQTKGEKLIVYKIQRRKNYRRKRGHRQQYTELEITGIETA